MSAQCQHKLGRYECWKCRDEWKEPKPMSIDVTSNNDALAAEVAALRHDIERHVQIAAEQAQEMEKLRQDLAAARALLETARRALADITLAGMSLPIECGDDEQAKMRFHARQAWTFISVAANAKSDIDAALAGKDAK